MKKTIELEHSFNFSKGDNRLYMKIRSTVLLITKMLFIIPLISFFTFINLSAEYKVIHSIGEASAELSDTDANSLVIFDVDNVLITSLSAINRPVGDIQRHKLSDQFFGEMSEKERVQLQSIVWQQGGFRLTESSIPCVIHNLQLRGVPTMALTALGTGHFGVIADMADYRSTQLKLFGIDFSRTSRGGMLVFNDLNQVYGNYPVYKEGILLTNWYQNKKGDVLVSYLNEAHLQPSKIIFFDDYAANLDSVKEKLADLNIEFIGIHYLSQSLLSDQLDYSIAEMQFEHLCSHGIWLDDNEIQ